MAVIDDVPRAEVTIDVDRAPLPEYQDYYEDTTRSAVSRYVEAQTGQNFAVFIGLTDRVQFRGDLINARVFADGNFVGMRKFTRPSPYDPRPYHDHRRVDGYNDGDDFVRFKFSALDIDPDADHIEEEDIAIEFVGSIVVQLHHMRNEGTTTVSHDKDTLHPKGLFDDLGTLSEKAVKGKAVSHSIPGGRRTSRRAAVHHHGRRDRTIPYNTYRDGKHNPFATFEIHYRSADALKAMLILPRTPSPAPPEQLNHDSVERNEALDDTFDKETIQCSDVLSDVKGFEPSQHSLKREAPKEDDYACKRMRMTGEEALPTSAEVANNFNELTPASFDDREMEVVVLSDDE